MPARRDGTEPMIAPRAGLPAPGRARRTSRCSSAGSTTPGPRGPSRSSPRCRSRSEEDWFERTVANQGRDGYHFVDLPPRGRPADRHDRAVRARPAQRQRRPRDLDRRPGGHGPRATARTRCGRSSAGRSTCCGSSGSGSTSTTSTRGRARRLRAGRASSTRGRRATRSSATARTTTSTGWRSSRRVAIRRRRGGRPRLAAP